MREKRGATSPLRGEVGPEGREGVGTPPSVAPSTHPGSQRRSDPPPQGEGGRYPHLSGQLETDKHTLPIRVYYEDTDFSGRVYHASYLRFLERGRTELLRALEVAQSDLHAEMGGLAFVVRKMTIDFLGAAVMDDVVTIITRPKEIRGASMILAQEVRRGGDVLVTADVMVAAVRAGRAVRIPDPLRAALSMGLA